MNKSPTKIDTDVADSPLTVLAFSQWLNKGFWLAIEYKWRLSLAAFITIILQFALLLSATALFQSFEGDPYLLTVACLLAITACLFYPVVTVGLSQIITLMHQHTLRPGHFFNALFIGFQSAFYRLLTLGAWVLFAHLIFVAIMGALSAVTTYLAVQSNTDLTSDAFIRYQNITLALGFIALYPIISAPFIFSPLLLVQYEKLTLRQAMSQSFVALTTHFFSFALLALFSVVIFTLCLVGLSLLPTLVSAVVSLLPWQNKLAVFQTLMMLPLSVLIIGLCFCFAWFYCALYEAYKQLFAH